MGRTARAGRAQFYKKFIMDLLGEGVTVCCLDCLLVDGLLCLSRRSAPRNAGGRTARSIIITNRNLVYGAVGRNVGVWNDRQVIRQAY